MQSKFPQVLDIDILQFIQRNIYDKDDFDNTIVR